MSEPKRYLAKISWTQIETEEHPAGEFVRWSDYARLKAEVERLRKAGDELLHEWSSGDEKEARNFMKALVIWNAAKEGKQS
jgi:hypothetical protein